MAEFFQSSLSSRVVSQQKPLTHRVSRNSPEQTFNPKMLGALTVFSLALSATASGPCDIYAAGGTPCVAAHSVVRALYGAYSGPLYAVHRTSDSTTLNISTVAPGSVADSASQDKFCAGTDCAIVAIFDQSPRGNDLTLAPPGGAAPHTDLGTNASRERFTLNGHPVYSAYFEGGMG